MEWNDRSPAAPHTNAHNNAANPVGYGPTQQKTFAAPSKKKRFGRQNGDDKKWRIASVILLFAVTLLVISLIAYLAFFSSNKSQSDYLDKSKFQAVFLQGGQVYFGRLNIINDDHLKLNEVYYLRVNQPGQASQATNSDNIQLVKLGCELHGPQDQMIITASQVTFWENLKEDGQVSQAIAKYIKDNPNGQTCQTTNTNSNNQNNSNTENNNQQPTN